MLCGDWHLRAAERWCQRHMQITPVKHGTVSWASRMCCVRKRTGAVGGTRAKRVPLRHRVTAPRRVQARRTPAKTQGPQLRLGVIAGAALWRRQVLAPLERGVCAVRQGSRGAAAPRPGCSGKSKQLHCEGARRGSLESKKARGWRRWCRHKVPRPRGHWTLRAQATEMGSSGGCGLSGGGASALKSSGMSITFTNRLQLGQCAMSSPAASSSRVIWKRSPASGPTAARALL